MNLRPDQWVALGALAVVGYIVFRVAVPTHSSSQTVPRGTGTTLRTYEVDATLGTARHPKFQHLTTSQLQSGQFQ